ncbi:MAG: THUMP domain-containing class I SAM-dependent RNA methyltransferase [Bdellovibrionia bacterium]
MAAEQFEFYATTAKGMESLLAQELSQLGLQSVKEGRGGVSFSGKLEAAYRACLWSRVASRIFLPLKTFQAKTPEDLYEGSRQVNWRDHFTVEQTFCVDFTATQSQISHSHYGALQVKDAIADQFRAKLGSRPSVNTVKPDVRVHVYLNRDQATLSLDLSGGSLHRRGYRDENAGVAAPMKENLAAAILMQAGWPKEEGHAFLDPMCGSGTLPIEAALMSARIAPGLFRKDFGFLGWQGHVPALWKRLLQEADEAQIRDKKKIPKIVGYDGNFRAVRLALESLPKAGVHGKVHIEKRDFAQCEMIAPAGVILLNPPYGSRLGEQEALKPLYRSIGDTFKQKFRGWTGFVFTGSSELAKVIGLKASQRSVFFNGPIECRLLKYELY